jgi:single-stranded-DNA-specific exonuclease
MAAGLTLKHTNLQEFEVAFIKQVTHHLTDEKLLNILLTDGSLDKNEINLEIAELLQNAGPWGQHFPEPIFNGRFDIVSKRIVAEKHLKLVLRYHSSGYTDSEHAITNTIDAIAFNVTDEHWPMGTDCVDTVYRLDINEYMGNRSAQLLIEQIDPVCI